MTAIQQIRMDFDGTNLIAVVKTDYDPTQEWGGGAVGNTFNIFDARALAPNINTGSATDFTLAVLNNFFTNFLTAGLAQSMGIESAFIGLTKEGSVDPNPNNGWTWADGTALGFRLWQSGEPNNSGGAEVYAQMRSSNGAWNDVSTGANNAGAAYTLNVHNILPGSTLNINGTDNSDVLRGTTAEMSRLRGFGGDDKLEVINSKGWLAGDDGNDVIVFSSETPGSQAGSMAYGGDGDDTFYSSGNVYMAGGGGRDTFHMADGDTVKGGSGDDVFYANIADAGDEFIISTYTNHEQIFLDVDDSLGVADLHFAGHRNLSGSAGEVVFKYSGGKTLILVDFDGDKTADATVTISGHHYIYTDSIDFV